MADVAYRGWTGWGTTLNSWPTGTAAGDLAMLVVVGDAKAFDGWIRHRRTLSSWTDYAAEVAIYSRIVPSDLSGTPGVVKTTTTPTEGAVVTFQNAGGVGRVRDWYRVPVQAGGAAFFVAYAPDYPYSPTNSDGVVLSPAGEGGPRPGPSSLPSHLRPTTYVWLSYEFESEATRSSMIYLGDTGFGLEIEPQSNPLAPTLYTPQPAADVSYNADVTFEWQHAPVITDGYQDAVRLRFRASGAPSWTYVTAAGGTSGTETTITQAEQTLTLNAGTLVASTTYEWQAATREAVNGLWSEYASASTFDAVSPPSVSVTGPTTVTDDLTPTVEWTPTTPEGVQTAYRVTVAEVGYDSGVRRSDATSAIVPVQDWANGGSYTAGVRVQQTGGSWSPEGTRAFSLSWTPPTTPTCTAANSSTGGIDVTVAGSDSGDVVFVQRTFDGGVTWVDVTQAPWTSTGADVVVKDVTVRYGVEAIYRARAATVLDGQNLTSAWDVSDPVTCTDTRAYIVNAADWTDYVTVLLRTSTGRTRVRESSVVYGLGDSRPMVDHAPYAGQTGTWTVGVESDSALESLADLLGAADGSDGQPHPLILRWPPNVGGTAEKSLSVAVVGGVTWRPIGANGSPWQDVTINWVEQ